MADALHQAGDVEKAEALFREAEALQAKRQSMYPLMYSLQGYRYCDLLLGEGRFEEVEHRAAEAIKIARQNNWLLEIALDQLSLGRAYLGQAVISSEGSVDRAKSASPGRQDLFAQAATRLDQAVGGLRRAGHQDLPAPRPVGPRGVAMRYQRLQSRPH